MSAPPPSRREQAFPSRLRGAAERVAALAAAVPVLALAADLAAPRAARSGLRGGGGDGAARPRRRGGRRHRARRRRGAPP
ncbi:MAG: hypothetical protein RML12_10840 [Xanthomonadales bacterium]|nr:hypothetical protein [Xanthomonadales bacterium]